MTESVRYEHSLGPLRVGLRKDLHVTRQRTRGGPRYVIHDPIAFQNHAFTYHDYQIMCAIVPHRSLEQVFAGLVEDQSIQEDEEQRFYEFVLWLNETGLLQLPVGQSDTLFERYKRKQKGRRSAFMRALVSLKIPLWNPDLFLQRTLRYIGWLFDKPGLILWCGLMLLVAWKCTGRLGEMFGQTSNLLSLGNLPFLWVALVGLKVLHEFGHAYACRRFGGAVPEMGVVFIILTPCAYVDATASWKFDQRARVAVAMAGMYVETLIAGIFALIWAGTQPGFLHDVSLNVVILASATTLLLNINPLMKFDGYYIFSDLMGVFNLQARAFKSLKGWVGSVLLGQPRQERDYSRGEKWLYAMYGPAAAVYRAMLAFMIIGLVMMQWPGAGLVLGAAFVFVLIVQPVFRAFVFLWSSDDTEKVRTRARLVAASCVVMALVLIGLLPVSWNVVAPGVVVPRVRHSVRAPARGFVVEMVTSTWHVNAGDLLCVLRDPDLETRRLELLGELRATEVSLDTVEVDDPTLAASHRGHLASLRARLRSIDDRLAAMTITAPDSGTLVRTQRESETGRFVQQGEELFQIQSGHKFVRLVLTDYEVSRARLEIESEAEVRWTCDPANTVRAVVREIRRSSSRSHLPLALTMAAGGDVYAEPTGQGTARASESYLHVFLETDSTPWTDGGTGLTVRVRVPGRVEVLGSWIRRRLVSFLDAWRMT